MKRTAPGRTVPVTTAGGRVARAFVPAPLPPSPAIALSDATISGSGAAMYELGRLSSAMDVLPAAPALGSILMRREAVASACLAGSQASLANMLLLEQGAGTDTGASQAAGYARALEHGMRRVCEEGLPVGSALLRELHAVQFAGSLAARPGQFRRTQIGDSTPGPPPWYDVERGMEQLDLFLGAGRRDTHALVRVALVLAQLDMLRPFLMGNGRTARLLVSISLGGERILRAPVLGLSAFLLARREQVAALLAGVRADGDWEAWIAFFVEAVRSSAEDATRRALDLSALARADRSRIRELGRVSFSAARLHHAMLEHPIGTTNAYARWSGLSLPSAIKSLEALSSAGVTHELTGRQRGRIYSYEAYLALVD